MLNLKLCKHLLTGKNILLCRDFKKFQFLLFQRSFCMRGHLGSIYPKLTCWKWTMNMCYSHTALSLIHLPLTILLPSIRYFTLYLYNNICICASTYIYTLFIYVYTHVKMCIWVSIYIINVYKYIVDKMHTKILD